MSMVENLKRLKDVDGLPKIQMRSPVEFFNRLKQGTEDIPIWVGELV